MTKCSTVGDLTSEILYFKGSYFGVTLLRGTLLSKCFISGDFIPQRNYSASENLIPEWLCFGGPWSPSCSTLGYSTSEVLYFKEISTLSF